MDPNHSQDSHRMDIDSNIGTDSPSIGTSDELRPSSFSFPSDEGSEADSAMKAPSVDADPPSGLSVTAGDASFDVNSLGSSYDARRSTSLLGAQSRYRGMGDSAGPRASALCVYRRPRFRRRHGSGSEGPRDAGLSRITHARDRTMRSTSAYVQKTPYTKRFLPGQEARVKLFDELKLKQLTREIERLMSSSGAAPTSESAVGERPTEKSSSVDHGSGKDAAISGAGGHNDENMDTA